MVEQKHDSKQFDFQVLNCSGKLSLSFIKLPPLSRIYLEVVIGGGGQREENEIILSHSISIPLTSEPRTCGVSPLAPIGVASEIPRTAFRNFALILSYTDYWVCDFKQFILPF